MKVILLIIGLLLTTTITFASEEITPYKYTDQEFEKGLTYDIPQKSRFTIKRIEDNAPDIVYYMSKPTQPSFPIAIVCGGSSSKKDIASIIHVHRYLLKEFLDLGVAVLTVEQWGVDGKKIDPEEFMAHYTRSARLYDHQAVIEHLKSHPPKGWNGKLIFLGASEGGPIITTLTTNNQDITLATINWSGAGDWSWRDELWAFIEGMKNETPWYIKLRMLILKSLPFSIDLYFPKTRAEYDQAMDKTLKKPDYDKEFMGMTYKYHADALTYPKHAYNKIQTPLLVVTGAKDTIIDSCDKFVDKAKNSGATITYLRVQDMDHYVRKRSDIITQTFEWLEQQLVMSMDNKEIVSVENSLRYPIKIKGLIEPLMNLSERMVYHKIPGMSIAIIDQGKIAWVKGYGTRTVDTNEPVDENTLFQASSITKMVTAMGVLLLVQEGKLDLDTDVGIYLKRWKVPKRFPYGNDPLTIRQLLSHTGGVSIHGLAGYREGETLPNVLEFLNGTKPISKDIAVKVIAKPGDKFQYSGGGITILEVLIEDVTGMPFKDYIQKAIFDPLGMTHSYLAYRLPNDISNFAVGHDEYGKPIPGKYHSHPSLSATGLWTTPTDLAKLGLNIQLSSQEGNGLLSPKIASLMTTRLSGNFEAPVALGAFIQDDGKIFGHSGSNPGSRCNARFLVDGGKGVVIMTNSDNGSLLEDELRLSVYNAYHWPVTSVEKTLATIDPETLHSYAGMFWEVVDEGTAKERKIESSIISVEEDHLVLQWKIYKDFDFREWNLSPNIQFYPESKTQFFGRHGSSLTFDENQSFKLFGNTQFKNRE